MTDLQKNRLNFTREKMKKFLVVAFCLVVGTSVSAQETEVVGDVQDNAASTIVEAPVDSTFVAAPQESETPVPVQDSEIVAPPEAGSESTIVEGTTEMMPLTDATVITDGYVDAVPCDGCGQALSVMNYPITATYAQAAPCNGCGQSVIAATPAPVNACCNNSTSRPQVVSRFRSRVSTRTSLRDRRASRRNPCCN